jgi:hypothetical protein
MTVQHPNIETAVQSIHGFIHEMNLGFETAASTMLCLGEETRNLLRLVASLKEETCSTVIVESHRQLQSVVFALLHRLDEIRNSSSAVAPWMRELKVPVKAISDSLLAILCACTDLMLFSINAKLVALDEDIGAGKTFTVITEELNVRSREMRKTALSLLEIVDGIERGADEAARTDRAALFKSDDDFAAVRRDMESAVHSFSNIRRQLFGAVAEAENHSKNMEPQIARLMGRLQEQDILRQSLEHIAAVLSSLPACHAVFSSAAVRPSDFEEKLSSTAEEFEFVKSAVDLSRALYKDTVEKITAYFEEIDHCLESLRRVGQAAQSLKTNWGNRRAEILRSVLLPMRLIPEMTEKLRCYTDTADKAAAPVRDVNAAFCTLARKMEDIKQMSIDLSVIENAMRIKTAGTFRLAAEATLLSSQIFEKDTAIRTFTEAAVDISMHVIKEGKNLTERKNEKKESGAAQSDASARAKLFVSLEEAASRFDEDIATIAQTGITAAETAASFGDELNRLTHEILAFPIETVLDETSAFIKHRQNEIETALGHPFPKVEVRERLQALVDRFAVFSQKKIATSVFDVAVVDGDFGGELTLF